MPGDIGDTRFVMYILENYYQSLLGHAQVTSPAMFYPVQGLLGYTDANAAAVPVFSFFRLVGFDMYDAFQTSGMVCDLMAWLFCFLLFKKGLGLDAFPASVGSAFYCFNNIRYNQINHFDLQMQFLLPLIILGYAWLYRNYDRPGKQEAFLILSASAMLLGLEFTTSFYLGWFFCFWFLIFFLILLAFRVPREALGQAFNSYQWVFLGAAFVFLLSLLPAVELYLPVLYLKGPRAFNIAAEAAPISKALFWMGAQNWAWGWLSKFPRLSCIPFEWENRLGLGLVFTLFWAATGLSLIARTRRLKSSRSGSIGFSFLPKGLETLETPVFLSVLISMAFVVRILHHNYLWELVYHLIPGAQAMKCISRFFLILALPASFILAMETQRLVGWTLGMVPGRKKYFFGALLAVLLSLVGFEQMGGLPFPGFSKEQDREKITALAREVPKNAQYFYVVLSSKLVNQSNRENYQIDAMLVSIMSGIPTLNGYDSDSPPGWNLWFSKKYERRVKAWILYNHLDPSGYRLVINDEY